MKKHLKTLALAALAMVFCAVASYAATYQLVRLPAPGEWTATGIGVGKLKAITVEGAIPTNGTVIVSRISADGTATNALLTRTASAGAVSDILGTGTNIWFFAGDRILRSGTATNASPVHLILE